MIASFAGDRVLKFITTNSLLNSFNSLSLMSKRILGLIVFKRWKSIKRTYVQLFLVSKTRLVSESDEEVTGKKKEINFSLSKIALNRTNLQGNSFQKRIIPPWIRKYCPKLDNSVQNLDNNVQKQVILSNIGQQCPKASNTVKYWTTLSKIGKKSVEIRHWCLKSD